MCFGSGQRRCRTARRVEASAGSGYAPHHARRDREENGIPASLISTLSTSSQLQENSTAFPASKKAFFAGQIAAVIILNNFSKQPTIPEGTFFIING
jgi:hypothetical protein